MVRLLNRPGRLMQSINVEFYYKNCLCVCLCVKDGKLEAEEFTEKLYAELKSSPQPYLVTFLKVSNTTSLFVSFYKYSARYISLCLSLILSSLSLSPPASPEKSTGCASAYTKLPALHPAV